jgi:hypothetical protein
MLKDPRLLLRQRHHRTMAVGKGPWSCGDTVIKRWRRMPEIRESIHPTGSGYQGYGDRGIFALLNQDRLRRVLSRMLDENEFLSPYGIRALSRYHADHPHIFSMDGGQFSVGYLPAESDTGMFGGNSNWRGPIWMPVNALLIRGLLTYYLYYGDNFKIECPTGSGNLMNLFQVGREIANRLSRIFLRDASGRRPVYGGTEKFQTDPPGRITCCSMNTSMETMARASAPAIRPAGRVSSRN